MVGAIIGAVSAHNAGGNVWAGAGIGAALGYFGAGIANIATSAMGISIATGTATGFGASAGASWGGSIITPLEGALITGTEFAIGGFAAGMASGYAGGEGSVGDMFAQAGIGAGIGFGSGFAIGYSYTAGWQNVLHGADTQLANRTTEIKAYMEQYNMLMLQGRFQEAADLKLFVMKSYDFYAWATNDIYIKALQHVDAVASKTTGEFAGVKFDWVGKKNPFTWGKVLSGNPTKGVFSAVSRSDFVKKEYTLLILKSADSQVVNQALKIIPTFSGRESNYILYGGAYNCYQGAGTVDSAINNHGN